MLYVLQVLYGLFAVGSTVLDYFIYRAFLPDVHHDRHLIIAEYTDVGEGVLSVLMLLIGMIIEMGLVKTQSGKTTWKVIVNIFWVISMVEALIRILSMTVVSIHIHPGELDFMGLFVVHVLCYYTLKYMVVLQQFIGLLNQIEKIKVTSENRPLKYMRNAFEIFDLKSKPKVVAPSKNLISYPSLSYEPLPQRNSSLFQS
eukprot:TRINITY_DN10080_c0_g1_i1.p1 TRINITY_DN10080_c0_g1~~TRINITY_DN10080_c0_g1_i1.p1  ORF type:complete len:200 (-),score=21.96 TRINITY_DN10080_c0_g1_i1:223-822(-)